MGKCAKFPVLGSMEGEIKHCNWKNQEPNGFALWWWRGNRPYRGGASNLYTANRRLHSSV